MLNLVLVSSWPLTVCRFVEAVNLRPHISICLCDRYIYITVRNGMYSFMPKFKYLGLGPSPYGHFLVWLGHPDPWSTMWENKLCKAHCRTWVSSPVLWYQEKIETFFWEMDLRILVLLVLVSSRCLFILAVTDANDCKRFSMIMSEFLFPARIVCLVELKL